MSGQEANGITEENFQEKFSEELNRVKQELNTLKSKYEDAVKASNTQDTEMFAKEMDEPSENFWATALGQINSIRKVDEAFSSKFIFCNLCKPFLLCLERLFIFQIKLQLDRAFA